jgi:hypothetical protein
MAFHLCFRLRHSGIQVNQEGLKLHSTRQPLVYADDDNILCVSLYAIRKITEAFGSYC